MVCQDLPRLQGISASIFPAPEDASSAQEVPRYSCPDEIRGAATFPPLVLRYPGTKTRVRYQLLHKILRLFPGGRVEYREPFFGNGTLLPGLKSVNPEVYDVWINDFDPYLANLWDQVQYSPEVLSTLR